MSAGTAGAGGGRVAAAPIILGIGAEDDEVDAAGLVGVVVGGAVSVLGALDILSCLSLCRRAAPAILA